VVSVFGVPEQRPRRVGGRGDDHTRRPEVSLSSWAA